MPDERLTDRLSESQIASWLRADGGECVCDICVGFRELQSLRDSDVVHIETERALSDASNDFIRRVREAAGIAEGMEVYEIPDRISALRASERELRGMIAGLVKALDLIRGCIGTTEINPANYDHEEVVALNSAVTLVYFLAGGSPADSALGRATQQEALEPLGGAALTPAVRAVAEAVEQEKSNEPA